jgi:hypothetical protein
MSGPWKVVQRKTQSAPASKSKAISVTTSIPDSNMKISRRDHYISSESRVNPFHRNPHPPSTHNVCLYNHSSNPLLVHAGSEPINKAGGVVVMTPSSVEIRPIVSLPLSDNPWKRKALSVVSVPLEMGGCLNDVPGLSNRTVLCDQHKEMKQKLSGSDFECWSFCSIAWGVRFPMDDFCDQELSLLFTVSDLEVEVNLKYSSSPEGTRYSTILSVYRGSGQDENVFKTNIPWFHGSLDERRIHFLELIKIMGNEFSSDKYFETARKCLRAIASIDLKLGTRTCTSPLCRHCSTTS